MLSALSRTVARALGGGIQTEARAEEDRSQDPEVAGLCVNVELRDVLSPLPEIALSRVADICARTVVPVYRVLRDTWSDDMNDLAQVMAELESASFIPDTSDCDRRQSDENFLATQISQPEMPLLKRRRSSNAMHNAPLIITGSDPTIPTIVITPCPSQPREANCLVPFQDALFGNRLTVPTHPALNDVFPPLIARPFPVVQHWRYEDGHWWAVLPDPEEQMTKGMFSRPLPARKQKGCLAPHRHLPRPPRGPRPSSTCL